MRGKEFADKMRRLVRTTPQLLPSPSISPKFPEEREFKSSSNQMPKDAVNYTGRVSEKRNPPISPTQRQMPAAPRVEPIGLCNFKRANHVEECGGGGAR